MLSENDLNNYAQEYDRLEAIRSSSEDLREERTFDIASGGLVLSVGIFTYLTANGKVLPCKWMIIATMISFGMAIVLNYLSHYASVKMAEKCINTVNDNQDKDVPYNSKRLQARYSKYSLPVDIMNCIVLACTLLGIVLIVVYAIMFVI